MAVQVMGMEEGRDGQREGDRAAHEDFGEVMGSLIILIAG